MIKRICIILIASLVLTCNVDDTNSEMGRSFILKTYTPSAMLPETQEFNAPVIVWTFKFQTEKIKVFIADGTESVVLDAGNYSYDLTSHICGFNDNKQLVINGIEYGILITDDPSGNLILTDACIDGHILVFEEALIL